MLKNVYTRIAVAAAIGTLISPSIVNKFSVIETNASDGIRNDVQLYGIAGATTAFVFVLLSMTIGPPAAA